MTIIPLVEHSRPRILMIDFSDQDVKKIQKAGFEVKRGASGIYEPNEFSIPYPVQDVEVVFALVQNHSYTIPRRKSSDSVEEGPFFRNLLHETWEKAGWIVLFIAQDTDPYELELLGLERIGVILLDQNYIPTYMLNKLEKRQKELRDEQPIDISKSKLPRFKGQDIFISDDQEAITISKYLKSAEMTILTCLKYHVLDQLKIIRRSANIIAFNSQIYIKPLIQDRSIDENVMAFKIEKSNYYLNDEKANVINSGRIIFLPDFRDKNCDVALSLLQNVITIMSPHLFNTPQHPWLEKYLPAPISQLQAKRENVIDKATKHIEQINGEIEKEKEKFAWLMGLLVSIGDLLQIHVADTLRFLDFEVEEVDKIIAPGERKREDIRIWDRNINFFALGEVKSTGEGRGASEEFITKTQTHQSRYARENKQAPPPAMLIVNFAIDLDPVMRAGRFYQKEVEGHLEDNCITAINSVALFQLCQYVLNEQLTKKQVRNYLSRGLPVINNITLDEVINVNSKHPA